LTVGLLRAGAVVPRDSFYIGYKKGSPQPANLLLSQPVKELLSQHDAAKSIIGGEIPATGFGAPGYASVCAKWGNTNTTDWCSFALSLPRVFDFGESGGIRVRMKRVELLGLATVAENRAYLIARDVNYTGGLLLISVSSDRRIWNFYRYLEWDEGKEMCNLNFVFSKRCWKSVRGEYISETETLQVDVTGGVWKATVLRGPEGRD
jgi:hypothetical protein